MKARLAVALLVSAGIAAAGVAQAQPADQCLRMQVSATGETAMWNHQAEAEKSAINAWTAQAAKQAGAAYSQWDKARAKSVSCDLASKSTVRCTARGTPCK